MKNGRFTKLLALLIFCDVGMVRAKAEIALTNLVYNMCRLVQIKTFGTWSKRSGAYPYPDTKR